MDKKELQVVALSASASAPLYFTLVLEEPLSAVKIPVTIGQSEAQSIAIHLEKMKISRPLTHDLFKQVFSLLQAKVSEVFIHDIVDDIFYTCVVLLDKEGQRQNLDARISDAIAIALRCDAPIYVDTEVLMKAAVEDTEQRLNMMKGSLLHYSDEALEQLLRDVLNKEDYISAARLRDMIAKRNKS